MNSYSLSANGFISSAYSITLTDALVIAANVNLMTFRTQWQNIKLSAAVAVAMASKLRSILYDHSIQALTEYTINQLTRSSMNIEQTLQHKSV